MSHRSSRTPVCTVFDALVRHRARVYAVRKKSCALHIHPKCEWNTPGVVKRMHKTSIILKARNQAHEPNVHVKHVWTRQTKEVEPSPAGRP